MKLEHTVSFTFFVEFPLHSASRIPYSHTVHRADVQEHYATGSHIRYLDPRVLSTVLGLVFPLLSILLASPPRRTFPHRNIQRHVLHDRTSRDCYLRRR